MMLFHSVQEYICVKGVGSIYVGGIHMMSSGHEET